MPLEERKVSSELGAQTAKKARKRRQDPKFYFVNVAVTPLRAHVPVRDAQKERCIRAHVMKDYLQKNLGPPGPSNTSPDISQLSEHLVQFSLPSRQKQQQSRRRSKKVDSDERALTSASAPKRMRAIIPKLQQSLPDVALAKALANNLLCKFPSTINTSTPGTMTLLEYYYHSFWDNSLAVNPEGQWMSTAISDPAVFHATLCLVALHKTQASDGPQASSYLWHRGEAINRISQNLADPRQATSDATIGAVAILSASDNSMHWPSMTRTSHIEGMITLVGLRGGLQEMKMDRHIQRVVAWADILHATTQNSLPHLEITRETTNREMERLNHVLGKRHCSTVTALDFLPKNFQKVLENLQALAMAKLQLGKKAVSSLSELRLVFSNLLFATEHRVLELGHTIASSPSVIVDAAGVQAIKAATLIFTLHGLRDMAITAAFFDILVWRLRDGLHGIFENDLKDQSSAQIANVTAVAPFLLWLCMNGWRACGIKTRQADREYFVEKAAVLCEIANFESLDEFKFQISRIVSTVENYEAACDGLWVDINVLTVLRDVRCLPS